MGNLTIPAIVLAALLCLAAGWYLGSSHVQAEWNDAKIAADKAAQQAQAHSDAVGAQLNQKLSDYQKTVANLNQELTNESAKMGTCGSTKLPASSLLEYHSVANQAAK